MMISSLLFKDLFISIEPHYKPPPSNEATGITILYMYQVNIDDVPFECSNIEFLPKQF